MPMVLYEDQFTSPLTTFVTCLAAIFGNLFPEAVEQGNGRLSCQPPAIDAIHSPGLGI